MTLPAGITSSWISTKRFPAPKFAEAMSLHRGEKYDQSIVVLEKIRKAIEQCNLINNTSFTISIGVSEFIYNENNIEKAIKRADERLYIAKNSGKNKISI